MIGELQNLLLRIREKRGSSWGRQLRRLMRKSLRHPLINFRDFSKEVMIGITYRCQCNCQHCGIASYQKTPHLELTTFEIKEIIRQIRGLPFPVIKISFSGGEPLLRKDVYQIIGFATKSGLFSDMNTNGILLTKENVRRLKASGLHHIYVSLDSVDPNEHDIFRGKAGCCKSALDGIVNCIEEGLPCSISTYVTKSKIHRGQIQRMIELSRQLKVVSLRLVSPVLCGRMCNSKEELLTVEDMNRLKDFLHPGFVYL